MSSQWRRGGTLAELIVVMFLLGFLMVGTFMMFRQGQRGFQQAVLRVGAIGDAERFSRTLSREVRLTHFNSLKSAPRLVTSASLGQVRRDGLAMCSLNSWTDPANFSGIDQPIWNRDILFYADADEPGRLWRVEASMAPSLIPSPYSLLSANFLDALADPSQVPSFLRSSTISHDVAEFRTDVDNSRRVVSVFLRMFRRGAKRMTSEVQTDEFQELRLSLRALNSYPDI